MKREREFVKNGAILTFGTIFPKVTALITLPIITGCLSKADYGIYDNILVLVSLVLPLATLEMQASAFRFLVKERENRNEQKKIITNIVFFTVPICILALILLYFLMGLGTIKGLDGINGLGNISSKTRLLMMIYFFVDITLITSRQIARGLGKNVVYTVSAFINAAIELCCMFILLYVLKGGLNEAITALIIAQSIAAIYVIAVTRIPAYIEFSLFSMPKVKEMLSYSWPLIPNSLSSWVMRVSDRLILLFVMGAEAAAVYGVANKLPNIFNLVHTSFAMAWQENAAVSVDDRDSAAYFGKMFDRVFDFFAGAMALLIAFTPVLFRLLIRGDYGESYNHMPILYLAVLFSAVSTYLGGIYIAHMKSKEIGITTAIAALTNFLINIFFVRKIGIYAATISTLVSYIWLAVYRMIDVQKIQKIKFNVKRFVGFIFILTAMSFVCFQRKTVLDVINMTWAVFFAAFINRTLILSVIKEAKTKLMK